MTTQPIAKKPLIKSKTLWSLAATALAIYAPAIAAAVPAINNDTVIGTIHGVGVPLGLIAAAISRVAAKHPLR